MRKHTTVWATALLLATTTACAGGGIRAVEPPERVAEQAAWVPATNVFAAPDGRTFGVRTAGDETVVRDVGGASADVRLDGAWIPPRVISSGPPDGFTPDGRILALAHAANSRTSRFALLPTRPLGQPRVVEFEGDFSFDAWSPRGEILYLIEHRPPAGSGHYVVRAYDVAAGKLRPAAIADKRTLGEEMAGHPIARASNSDGQIVATLYRPHGAAAGDHGPFIHLLFTEQASALCVDLPRRVGDGWQLGFADGRLRVFDRAGRAAYVVNTVNGRLSAAG